MEIVEFIFFGFAYIAVVGFLLSGLDDLFFDSYFLRYLFRSRKRPRITLEQLKLVPEQWTAIFVPAWQEGGIVNKMAEYASRVLLYEKYDIFIGVYPNDEETMRCVDEVCARYPRVHKVVVPHPGPTNKADCLNWIYRAMRLNEVPGVREYKIVAIHDAEDVLHPLVLKVYNYFVPREYDMAQLPVFALEHPVLKFWSANTYIDDFSELHTKDLFIRESIGGIVPSAGVGTCFSRSVLYRLSSKADGDPFRLGNLTEDYEIGIRIKRMGYRTGIISYPVDRIVRKRRKDGTTGPPKTVAEIVAVRENFPTTFWSAVLQRTRWILGISFQTWEQTGWAGTLPMRYTLLRDRRAPLTHMINMAGYMTLLYVLGQWMFSHTPLAGYYYVRPLFTADSILWNLVIVDTCLLVYRAAQKFISVYDVYGVKQALFSVPRVVVGNLINFVATMRAFKLYIHSKLFNKELVWHKTTHVFPDAEELSEYSKSIEDLLVEKGLATRDQIFQALKSERAGSAPSCLLQMGLLDENQFTDVWEEYSGLPVHFLNPDRISEDLLRQFPEIQSREWEAIPIEQRGKQMTMAFREPPATERLGLIAKQFTAEIKPVLARPSAIAFARNRAYPRLVLPSTRMTELSDSLRAVTGLDDAAFLELLNDQQTAGSSLPDILVDRGHIGDRQAREIWSARLGCRPYDKEEILLDQEFYYAVGPAFWWLHRMLPTTPGEIITSGPPHPQVVEWLEKRTGTVLNFRGELPGRVVSAMRSLGIDLDPDKALIDNLAGKGLLKEKALKSLASMRSLIKDPLTKLLLIQGMASEKDIQEAFLEISYLSLAKPWDAKEVQRLRPVLPPGFAVENRCFCLNTTGGLTLGIGQIPSGAVLQQLYERLAAYPVCFQALTLEDVHTLSQSVKR